MSDQPTPEADKTREQQIKELIDLLVDSKGETANPQSAAEVELQQTLEDGGMDLLLSLLTGRHAANELRDQLVGEGLLPEGMGDLAFDMARLQVDLFARLARFQSDATLRFTELLRRQARPEPGAQVKELLVRFKGVPGETAEATLTLENPRPEPVTFTLPSFVHLEARKRGTPTPTPLTATPSPVEVPGATEAGPGEVELTLGLTLDEGRVRPGNYLGVVDLVASEKARYSLTLDLLVERAGS